MDIKTQIDDEYSIKPNGGSRTPWIISAVAVTVILLFGAIILIYFLFFGAHPMHDIIVSNASGVDINVIFGAEISPYESKFLPIRLIPSGESFTYKSTPGVTIRVQGFRNGDSIGSERFTTALLQLAGGKTTTTRLVTDGTNILKGLYSNEYVVDRYGVSLQLGYNLPVTIAPTKNFQLITNGDKFICYGPTWTRNIPGTGPTGIACPSNLQSPGGSTGYQVCLSACETTSVTNDIYCCKQENSCTTPGGCEATWPNQNYYNVFAGACPNCLITNCDTFNYSCSTDNPNDGLIQYTITFLPLS
jgi:hypothetical protein